MSTQTCTRTWAAALFVSAKRGSHQDVLQEVMDKTAVHPDGGILFCPKKSELPAMKRRGGALSARH